MGRIAMILFLVCGIISITTPVLAQEVVDPMVADIEEETDIIAGKITAVDVSKNTATVTDEAGKNYTLTATREETSIWKGDNTIELSDVKVGEPVELEYYKDKDGKLVAIWIDVLTEEAARPLEAMPEAVEPAE